MIKLTVEDGERSLTLDEEGCFTARAFAEDGKRLEIRVSLDSDQLRSIAATAAIVSSKLEEA